MIEGPWWHPCNLLVIGFMTLPLGLLALIALASIIKANGGMPSLWQ